MLSVLANFATGGSRHAQVERWRWHLPGGAFHDGPAPPPWRYPLPLPPGTPVTFTLTDALDRTVRQRYVTPAPSTAGDTRAELELAGLPAGGYSVRLLSSEGSLTKRLMVE